MIFLWKILFLWQDVMSQCTEYALKHNHSNSFLSSNFRTFLNMNYFSSLCKDIKAPWSGALTSMCLTGVTAPLLIAKGYKSLLIGSTRTIDFPYAFGSHPLLDNAISFAGISIHHDQDTLTRLGKINMISRIAKKYKIEKPYLRVCFNKERSSDKR